MSKSKLNNVIHSLESVSLSTSDRGLVRKKLSEHIDANKPVQSPWMPIISPLRKLGRSSSTLVAVVLLLAGGISLAAEAALPGDPLYSFKLNVNENFMSLTALSPAADAVYESRLANRRISELEVLAARGELDEEVSADLTASISKHTASAREQIAKISASGESGDAATLETELLSSLEVHSEILDDLARKDGKQATATANAAAQLRQVAQSKVADDISLSKFPTSTHRFGFEESRDRLSSVQTKRLLERTADRLQSARAKFSNELKDIKSEVVRNTVEGLLVTSASEINQAIDLIEEDKYKAADPLLRSALTHTHEAVIILDTRRILEATSGVAIDDLFDSRFRSSATSSQVGGADVVPEKMDNFESDNDNSLLIKTEDTKQGDSTPSSTPEIQGVSTSTPSDSEEVSENNFIRNQTVSASAQDRINDVLDRVEETLSSHVPQGFLPARQSHEDEK